MSQQEKKKITKVYKYPSEITPAAIAATTSKRASKISEITPAAITSNETTPVPAITSKSTVTSKSKVQHMKEQYKNFK
ncbi:8537_t:CDS:1, partial [Rhizophagus irregularis]